MTAFGVFLLFAVGTVSVSGTTYDVVKPTEWWQTTNLYQIWPRSFKDSDGDGIGDLNGITSKIPYLAELGVEVIWISPIFASPMSDSGYDIADYRAIHPMFGTEEDFDRLVATCKEYGMKVALDMVPNHTSDEHEWFIKSAKSIEPYTDYYVWHEGILVNGTRQPPNNWMSLFNTGSAWEWNSEREAYYLHQFQVKQPDLNFTNPLVIEELKEVFTFWMDRDVDAFRVDAVCFLMEDPNLQDEPVANNNRFSTAEYYHLHHIHTRDLPGNLEIIQILRDHLDDYSAKRGDGIQRAMFTEAYANISSIMEYYNYGAHVPFNFFFVTEGLEDTQAELDTAEKPSSVIDLWMSSMPTGGTANWVLGNHDMPRIATKLGKKRVDSIIFLLYCLPGVATLYSGDELGTPNTYLTWEQTQDLRACSTNPDIYELYSRDPMRTPYLWDNSTAAGFSTNPNTMLPVYENYLTLNLAAQMEAPVSHYKNAKAALHLRKSRVLREGNLNLELIDDDVIAFTRELEGERSIAVLINWNNSRDVTISLEVFENLSDNLEVLIADIYSGIAVGDKLKKSNIKLPSNAALVLREIPKKTIPVKC